MVNNRDNFSEKTRRILRERVGGKCSNPLCNRETCGPSDLEDKSLIIGEAAHIRAAAPGGPRYDPTMTSEERMHISNGIWLCRDCARLIDIDASAYPVEKLLSWKKEAERRQREHLGHKIRMQENVLENQFPIYLSETPPSVVECYIERRTLEESIKERILSKKHCVITGIGGIGKTETIKKVLQMIQNQECCETGIRFIIWVTFSNNDLKGSIINSLPEYRFVKDSNNAWGECWRLLQQYGDQLLMVIDNVEAGASDPELEHLAFYPCRIAVTSRRETIGGLESIPVIVLPVEDCARLFNSYYKGQKDPFNLSQILHLIDYHTIMIELLAKAANMEEWSIEELLRKLIDHGFHMSDEAVEGHHEKLRNENSLINQLIILFSIMNYSDTFKSLLEQVSVIPAIPFHFDDISGWTSIKKKSDLEKMVCTGWLQSDFQFKTTYIMHSVIASAIRVQFENTLYYDCRNIIHALTNDMYYEDKDHGYEKAWMIPFSWSVSDVMRGQLCNEDDAAFLTNLANIYCDIGNFDSAKEFYYRAYDIRCALKSGSIDLSIDYYNLAQVYLNLDKLYIACEYGEKCLKFRKEHYGAHSANLLRVYGLLGPIYHRMGNQEKAEEFFNEGLDIIQNNSSVDQIIATTLRCDMASFYRDRGYGDDYKKAVQLYDLCLKEQSELYPDGHPETAELLENYAVLKQYQGEYSDALDLTLKAQKIKMEMLPEDHPDVIESYINMGYIYYLLDRHEESLAYYGKAEKLLDRCPGAYLAMRAALYNNKALTLKGCGDYESALKLYENTEKLRLSYLPETHELVLSARNNIAHSLSELGRHEEAIKIYLQLIDTYKQMLSDKDIESEFLAVVYNNVAEAYCAIGLYDQAKEYCENSLIMKAVVFGKDSVDYAMSLNTLALIQYYQKEYVMAETTARDALRTYKSCLPEKHHLLAIAYFNLALIEDEIDKDEEALTNYHQAIEIFSFLGYIDDILFTAEYIADIYQRNGIIEEEKIYRDWIKELQDKYV